MDYTDVIRFWFEEAGVRNWFAKSAAFDMQIRQRFSSVHAAAVRGELDPWRNVQEGRLAEIILLDQFSRNMYRESARAFAQDSLALALAQEAVRAGADQALAPAQKAFMYMPYMHSESAVIHADAMRLFAQPGLESNLAYEVRHKAVIDRFGRYPHRNRILDRQSTPEEEAFLAQSGSSF
jgi:uncharacterized protein (DUF924 family)